MSDAHHEDSQHRRPHLPPMAGPFLEFDLTRELEQLHYEPPPTSGQNAKTLAKYDDLRIVLIALRAHTRIPGHQADGRISVHTLRGHIRMRALERTFDLRAGNLLALDQGLLIRVAGVRVLLAMTLLTLVNTWLRRDFAREWVEGIGVRDAPPPPAASIKLPGNLRRHNPL